MCANQVNETTEHDDAIELATEQAWMVGFVDGCFVGGVLLVVGVIAWASANFFI